VDFDVDFDEETYVERDSDSDGSVDIPWEYPLEVLLKDEAEAF
jgi:hypothetical protein